MKYILALNKFLEVENFEKKRNNTAYIHIKNKKGEYITDQCTVKIILNNDGMLGLGKSLIRYAYEKEKIGGPLHFYKAQPDKAIIETLKKDFVANNNKIRMNPLINIWLI